MVPLKGLRQPGRYRLQPCLLWPLDGGTSIDFQGAFADRVVTACFAKEAGFVSCFFLFFFFFLFVFHNFRLLVSESIFFFFWPPGVSSALPASPEASWFSWGDNTVGNGI